MNRWHNIHDELPAIGAECIVLNAEGRISFAHMVDKAVAVDHDGWNIPNVVWWTRFEPSEEMEEYYGTGGEPKQKSHGPMSRHEMSKLSRVFCHNHCDKALRLHCDIYNARGHAYSCQELAQFQTDVRYVFNDGHIQTDEED